MRGQVFQHENRRVREGHCLFASTLCPLRQNIDPHAGVISVYCSWREWTDWEGAV